MKTEIEAALKPLLGLPLSRASRAADMEMLSFGEQREVPKRSGGTRIVGSWALHLQCAWRIRDEHTILIASSDCYRRADHLLESTEDFNWDVKGANRRDQLTHNFLEQNANSLFVTAIIADNFGDFSLRLTPDFTLETFSDITAQDYEHWRLLPPAKSAPHFVVTTAGIED